MAPDNQAVWFEFGQTFENDRVLEILDNLENSLVESEEDAKMTIHIIRKLIDLNE